jgi:hypothetical protein
MRKILCDSFLYCIILVVNSFSFPMDRWLERISEYINGEYRTICLEPDTAQANRKDINAFHKVVSFSYQSDNKSLLVEMENSNLNAQTKGAEELSLKQCDTLFQRIWSMAVGEYMFENGKKSKVSEKEIKTIIFMMPLKTQDLIAIDKDTKKPVSIDINDVQWKYFVYKPGDKIFFSQLIFVKEFTGKKAK